MLSADTCSDLVVLSHLRWTWVWQRPQHLISRLARDVPVVFIEEPQADPVLHRPVLRREADGAVTRLWWAVPGAERWIGFGDPAAAGFRTALATACPPRASRIVWLYTAMALEFVDMLEPDHVVYDVMDDLASFKGAAPEQRFRHHAALRRADTVFTGGRSLHAGVLPLRRTGVHCFPSGVEREHYASATLLRPPSRPRPVAGYVGVIDERIDLQLVADVAAALPDWDLQIVGPVAKIDRETLPAGANIYWLGARAYRDLPKVMAGFDVALMPFARNEATRSISPTKTLEYFAAGLPVVSTRVPDVVADYGTVVRFAEDGAGFAAACREALDEDATERQARLDGVLRPQQWDFIAGRIGAIITAARSAASSAASSPA